MPLGQKCALECESVDESTLWHLRYGYSNFHGLKLLKQKEMMLGLPYISLDKKICEGCIYGKMHRLSFTKLSRKANNACSHLRSFKNPYF